MQEEPEGVKPRFSLIDGSLRRHAASLRVAFGDERIDRMLNDLSLAEEHLQPVHEVSDDILRHVYRLCQAEELKLQSGYTFNSADGSWDPPTPGSGS